MKREKQTYLRILVMGLFISLISCSNCMGVVLDCDDGNACTIDSFDGQECVYEPIVCDDDISCTTDSCDANTGCVFTPDDSLCDDGNDCTDDSCDAASGCQSINNLNPCDDGNVCTAGDTCLEGLCMEGPPLNCDDGDDCTDDSCDSTFGCQSQNAQDGTQCDDGDACTDENTCLSGVCGEGIPLVCDDGKSCSIDSCDLDLGCLFDTTDCYFNIVPVINYLCD